ncbi:hypothetical protein FK216_12415 [Moraxellaceae bacterium AER2_44_116]|nr:hypothetical protein FK216_12415 [Moraxellaceae bacterium AER2_44_116]
MRLVMTERFQILSLSGGGFRGLYTAQVLADLEEKSGLPIAKHFDLLAGTSIGGILALAAACEIPMALIVDLFCKHGHEIFQKRPFWQNIYGLRKSPYSSDGLRKLLSSDHLFGKRLLSDAKHPVIVPSINYTKGIPVVFKTPHHDTIERDHVFSLVDVALATSAAPAYFPRHVMDSQQYVDGGLCANNPALLGLHEADYYFNIPLDQIWMLSVGTLSSQRTVNAKTSRDGGAIDWAESNIKIQEFPKNIIDLTLSSQQQMMQKMAEHRLQKMKGRFIRIDETLTAKSVEHVGLDQVTPWAIETLIGNARYSSKVAIGQPDVRELLHHTAPSPKWYNGPNKNASVE